MLTSVGEIFGSAEAFTNMAFLTEGGRKRTVVYKHGPPDGGRAQPRRWYSRNQRKQS